MGREEHGGTWHMDAAQLDTQRKKGEAILKTSSTVYSTNRSSSSTRPAKLQLDRAEKFYQTPRPLQVHRSRKYGYRTQGLAIEYTLKLWILDQAKTKV
ncbi:unnamed protein product [Microthlaspi erraticum]|uniref:Uncharacterized protein n=1 Tax=Microthlaspi erraticum TaxID=1685480 RepID=A0A6D2KBN0_9BRAS|nr:unnamed protein product [Microthlaspi erraticum]